MTRKLVLVNMSNWADEAYDVGTIRDGTATILRPGEYVVVNAPHTVIAEPKQVGAANGYQPPEFPSDLAQNVTEKRPQ